jgi:hypothetical protein
VDKTDEAIWLAFEVLARENPDDHGVRMTADLGGWLIRERQRRSLPAPLIMQQVLGPLTQLQEHDQAAEHRHAG